MGFAIRVLERFLRHLGEVAALNRQWHKAQVRNDPHRVWTLACTSQEGLIAKRAHHIAHLDEIDRLLAR